MINFWQPPTGVPQHMADSNQGGNRLASSQCVTVLPDLDFPMADSSSRFGFVAFAETWNGRLAMLGFVIGLATELLTGQGILSQIGLG